MSARNFILTLNLASLEYYEDIKQYLTKLTGMQYILVTEHIGQENKHYHIYVQYQRSKKLSVAKLHGAHIEKSYGSAQKNIAYLKCEDDKHKSLGITYELIYEDGEPNLKGGDYSIKGLLEYEKEEDLPDYRMYNTWKDLKFNQPKKVSDYRKNVKVYYIQGPSGIGKTNRAFEIAEEFENTHETFTDMIKFEKGFYNGVHMGAKIAIYDDFRDSHMKPSEFINLIDYNKHWMNIKGGSILNNYELIIITSVQKLDKLYRNMWDDEPRKQWIRRVDLVDMFPREVTLDVPSVPRTVRYYTNSTECYYCDNGIICDCQCVIDNIRCIENQCNLDKLTQN